MTSNQDSVQSLINHLKDNGIDTTRTKLVATVALLPAGDRDHYSGKRVKVFHPVAVRLEFMQPGHERPIIAARFNASDVKKRDVASPLLDIDDFNAHVQLEGAPAGASRFTGPIATLMRELVSKHREITGEVSAAYEHIEVDPLAMDQITSQRFGLDIDLERLAKYIALEDERFALLCDIKNAKTEARFNEIGFEMLMLQEGFIKQPCSRELYNELRREFVAQGYVTSMDFMDYYQWFRRSEALFDVSGQLTGGTRNGMEMAIKAWNASGGNKDNLRKSASFWANRNFNIHPRHREAVERFIDEVMGGVA